VFYVSILLDCKEALKLPYMCTAFPSFLYTMDNPTISLAPDMILKILEELSSIDNPLILQFCQLLEHHPVARSSMAPSLGHSLSGASTTLVELSSQSLHFSSPSKFVSLVTERQPVLDVFASELADINQGPDSDSNNNCCHNGIKLVEVGHCFAWQSTCPFLQMNSTYHNSTVITFNE
jgi:hypothetical protein